MFDLINFAAFNVGPLDLSLIPRLPLSGNQDATFNQCCGTRVELSPYTWYKNVNYEYFASHTKGIRLIPGKVNPDEVKILPGEKLVEFYLDGNTLSFIVLKKELPLGDKKVGLGFGGFSDKKYTLTENTNNVSVLFPFFSGMTEPMHYPIDKLFKDYPRVKKEDVINWHKYFINVAEWVASQRGYQVFVITREQLEKWEKYVKEYNVNVVQEERNIINNNYSADPRLNLFLTYKE